MSTALAAELPEYGLSVKGLGMGNAYTLHARGHDAVNYNPAAFARMQGFQFRLMGLGIGIAITADQASGTVGIAQDSHQGHSKAVRLVGDNAPFDITPFQFVNQRCGVVEQLCKHANVARVIVEEDIAQCVVVRRIRLNAKAHLEQAARTIGCLQLQYGERQWW